MATYKVIQDIEAEDKLIGPLSLRQFIYAAIVIILGFVAYLFSKISIIVALPLVLPILFFGALAAPFSQDQSTEVWLLAKIRFLLKPRIRKWSQDGMKDLVTITAPKKDEQVLTDGLSQTQIRSRLGALANTLDSRGWAVKNASITSDRLVSSDNMPRQVQDYNPADAIDMMDAEANVTAQNLDRMIQQTAQTRRQDLVARMQQPQQEVATTKQPDDYWFMQEQKAKNKAGFDSFGGDTVLRPGVQEEKPETPVSSDEQAIINKVKEQKASPGTYNSHMKTIQPLSDTPAAPVATIRPPVQPEAQKPQAQPEPNPGIMRLASNDDLNISTIAREANRGLSDGVEVEVSLH
jgi:hypothetical protein